MSEPKKAKREPCRLHAARGIEAWCTREHCIYWRLLQAQDVELSNEQGCGLQHYHLVEGLSPDMAEWLLTMKKRLENTTPEAGKSRITFKHREQ
jgi:hypothetical protein